VDDSNSKRDSGKSGVMAGGLEIEVPRLELPPETNVFPEAQASLLLGADSLATLSTRLATAEALLGLLTKNLKFQDFMREVLGCIIKAVKCEAGSILEADHEKRVLFFRATAGQSSDRLSNITIPWGVGIVGHVAESRRPILLQDTESDSRYLKSLGTAVGFQGRNLMAAPIVVRGQVFCVLELLNRGGRPSFDEKDLDLFVMLSEMTGRAIEIRLMLNGTRKAEAA
jgi:signal transduction protein with GAF and PtsI domain